VLLVAAVAIVIVLLASGGKSNSGANSIPQLKIGKIALPAADSGRQNLETIYTPSDLTTDPAGQIKEAHALGFDRIKVNVAWSSVAPDPLSRHEPRFNAADPAAYPAANWAIYDEVIRLCEQYHLKVDLALAPSVPWWAEGPGEPQPTIHPADWNPNAAMFEKFAQAVGTRYSGHYTPKGQKSPLPRVDFWSIWNEPNEGSLGVSPQTIDHNTVESAPYHYRMLADAAWRALRATGHGSDTTLIGELAPIGAYGHGQPGDFSQMAPITFLRALYCVGSDDRPLQGTAATVRHCPATAAASKRFAAANPVLFHATALAMHPYPYAFAPDQTTPGPHGNDNAVLAQLPGLFTTLDRLQAAYGSSKQFDVYDTEFGYQTSPPATQSGTVSPAKAAAWLNWSQYISWRLPRLLSYDQYELQDPPPLPGKKLYARFASGVVTYQGQRKPGWYAVRMPIWLPAAHQKHGGATEVWGQVGPAKTYASSRRAPAEIQFKPSSGGAWKTLKTVSTRTAEGYFDVPVTVPASGSVRIRWTPPSGAAIVSRSTAITAG
jgi:hypothetical protein